MSISDFDIPYREALMRLPRALEQSYGSLTEAATISLEGAQISVAILLRMSAFYRSQAATKAFLGKQVATAAADFFVETILFYLKAFIQVRALPLVAFSERPIERRRGALRPDISIWRADHLVAAFECKTQLGWNRSGWAKDFADREARLKATFSAAQVFLLVLTGRNWTGFENDPRLGNQIFILSRIRPTAVSPDDVPAAIHTPIEPLFEKVAAFAERAA